MTELDERLNTIADTAAVDMCGEIEDDQKVILKAIYLGMRAFAEQLTKEIGHDEKVAELALPGWETGYATGVRYSHNTIQEAIKALD